ncbi:MAG: DNA topoisomerase VI subunit B [Candidatus Aenigmarchaeota archaeon]|nr:DNA topoisomerase VI subunit B [Candidatus Aenigmarchaeota archaeon]
MCANAEEMAQFQKEISISEFFEKNRHLLGYDNKIKALLTIVKEAVDNALDACEEARILPDIYLQIKQVDEEKYEIIIQDNGPGIVEKQIPKIFGKLLYGSKFHRHRQSRGQQGIGISGVVLYAQLTTGMPTVIESAIGDGNIHNYKLRIEVGRNEPKIVEKSTNPETEGWRGTRLRFVVEAVYREHKQSVLEYLRQTAIANPFANITFDSPNGRNEFKRGIDFLPKEPKAIQPHLEGVEIGILSRMAHQTVARTVENFFIEDFTRVGKVTAGDICSKAGVDPKTKPKSLTHEDFEKLIKAIKKVKLINPPMDCLSPLGTEAVISGLKKELDPIWVDAVVRSPSVYRGWPFQIEVGIAYGGSVKESKVMRLANRVPLLYMAGDCAITKSVNQIDWKNYKLSSKDLSEDPISIFVHMVSVWVPFTSESKEAVASYPEIIKEIKLALQECARKLGLFLSGQIKAREVHERKKTLEKYVDDIATALSNLSGEERAKIEKAMMEMIKWRWGDIDEQRDGKEPKEDG